MRKNKKKIHTMHQHRPKEPETEKEIVDRIRDLEYTRIKVGHYPHPRRVAYEEAVTNEIKRLQTKLEGIQAFKKVQ